MKKTVTCNLELSLRDLSLIVSALSSVRATKGDILRFYDENPDALHITPLGILQEEYDACDRLVHVFSDL